MKRGLNMKSEREIHEEIYKLMDMQSEVKCGKAKRAQICCQIDALLWVIGDNSGLPLFTERE